MENQRQVNVTYNGLQPFHNYTIYITANNDVADGEMLDIKQLTEETSKFNNCIL